MPDFSIETSLNLAPGTMVVGLDEAGRGPLAGPVTAAAVGFGVAGCAPDLARMIDDSKRLSASRRHAVAIRLRRVAVIGLGWADRAEIDRLNILHATMLAMQRAFADLVDQGVDQGVSPVSGSVSGPAPGFALIDGNRVPDLPCPAKAVVRGDARSLSIAAASIIAKTARDAHMHQLAQRWPGYGWERNAGYGTKEHLAALTRLGVTPQHRRSFAPVRRMLD